MAMLYTNYLGKLCRTADLHSKPLIFYKIIYQLAIASGYPLYGILGKHLILPADMIFAISKYQQESKPMQTQL